MRSERTATRIEQPRSIPCLLASVLATMLGAGLAWSAETAAAKPLTLDMAASLVVEVSAAVERTRGLEFRETVPVRVIGKDGVRQHMLKRLGKFHPEQALAALAQAYGILGLLPPGTDVVEMVLEAVTEQAGGFYDPEAGTYYLMNHMPAVLAPAITAHELTHALEDQHFDLDDRLHGAKQDDDRLFALGAVHEGSAMMVMSLYVAKKLMTGQLGTEDLQAVAESEAARAAELAKLPPVILRQLLGPYLLGVRFLTNGKLLSLMADGYPHEQADRAYGDGPTSSEQILHPEKYWDPEQRDDPRPVEVGGTDRLEARGWARRAEGSLGELNLAVLVGAETPVDPQNLLAGSGQSWTNVAASGWGGDRWELWARGGDAIVLLSTVWDSDDDAAQFAEALPPDANLRWKRSGDAVAIVGGMAGKRKAGRLLDGMLAATAK